MVQCALIQGVLLVTSPYLQLMLAMVAFRLLHSEVDLPRQLTSTSLDIPHHIHLLPLWQSIGHPCMPEITIRLAMDLDADQAVTKIFC